MRTAFLGFLAVLGLVYAQDFAGLGVPTCATSCLTSAISAVGCGANDQACQCGSSQAAIQTAVTPCLLTACDQADLLIAASLGLGVCSAFLATYKPTSAVPITTTAASVSTTPTTAKSTSTTSVVAGTTSVSVTTKASSSMSATGSSSANKSSSGSKSTSASSTASAPPIQISQGAAAGMAVLGIGGLAGLIVGMVAIL